MSKISKHNRRVMDKLIFENNKSLIPAPLVFDQVVSGSLILKTNGMPSLSLVSEAGLRGWLDYDGLNIYE